MTLFRFHRGGFEESLKTSIGFKDLKDLESKIRTELSMPDGEFEVRDQPKFKRQFLVTEESLVLIGGKPVGYIFKR